MSAVPALRKVREERGTLDRGKTKKLKVGPPAVDKSQSIEKPHFSPKTREMGHPRVLNQGQRVVHGVEDVGHPPLVYYRKALELEKQLTTGY
ncbi:MAG TPA: hypothetical protein VHV29_19160 [Terriglobales bacterium]|jgi:hypothetical protein|nr:hypothetical protein [Terriglobales bacterium]